MTQQTKTKCIISAVAIVGAILLLLPSVMKEAVPSWWPSRPLRLGLDFRGGVLLRYEVISVEAVEGRVAQIAAAVRSELRAVKAPIVRARAVSPDTFEVVLLSEGGAVQARDIVRQRFPEFIEGGTTSEGEQTKVSFSLTPKSVEQIEKQSVDQAIETIRRRVDQFGVAEPTIQRQGEKGIIVQLPDVKDPSAVEKLIGKVAKLEFRLVADPSHPAREGRSRSYPNRRGGDVMLEEEVLMGGDSVESANVEVNPQSGEFEVMLKLNSFGAQTFGRITSENTGRRLAIVLDGRVESDPVINEPITGGTASITGNFGADEATQLVIVLKSGALPASLKVLEKKVVGATLGADAISSSVYAALIGSLAISLFMIVYYKKSGLLSVACLIVNLILMLALLAWFGATITLPGIAGLALTIGMAVDASVLLFERMREELRNGATYHAAVEAGFDRAYLVILDSNITHLIAGFMLFSFGTGPIKGFAVTLIIGISTTLFSALYLCRTGMELFDMKNSKGSLSI